MLGDKMSFWYLLVLAHKEERIQRKNSMNKQDKKKTCWGKQQTLAYEVCCLLATTEQRFHAQLTCKTCQRLIQQGNINFTKYSTKLGQVNFGV